jgi:hypothetical protein
MDEVENHGPGYSDHAGMIHTVNYRAKFAKKGVEPKPHPLVMVRVVKP